jgi:putative transposase
MASSRPKYYLAHHPPQTLFPTDRRVGLAADSVPTLREAQELVEIWRCEYNDLRPHSSLEYKTPSEFAKAWRDKNKSENSARAASSLRPTASANLQRQAEKEEILSL